MIGWMENISPFGLELLDTALNESASFCVAVFSESGEVLHANKGMRELFRIEANGEWQPADLLTPAFERLMSMPDSDEAVFEGLFTFGNGLDVFRNIKGKAYRRENKLFIIGEFNVSELENLNLRISASNQEINNLQRELIKEKLTLESTYAQLQSAYDLTREAVATKDKFFSIIAHDLRNSFQILIAGAELLMLESIRTSPAKVLARGESMYQASQTAFDLLNNLLTWARSQTGTIQYRPQELNLFAAVHRAMHPLLNKAETKNIIIDVHISENLSVFADHDMLNTILMNLLGNALKFCRKGDSVTVAARDDGHHVTVSFCDTGVGMDNQMLEQLFGLGNQRKSTGTDGEQGTGLGLVLCKEFVERNGGKIWAQSSVGKGSIFSFTLPKLGLANSSE
jgi:signal transduction histidine kinase